MLFTIEENGGDGMVGWDTTVPYARPFPEAYKVTHWQKDTYRLINRSQIEHYAVIEDGQPVVKTRHVQARPSAYWFETGKDHQLVSEYEWERQIEVSEWRIEFETLEELDTFCTQHQVRAVLPSKLIIIP